MSPSVSVGIVGLRLEVLAWSALVSSLPGIRVVADGAERDVCLYTGSCAVGDGSGTVIVVRTTEAAEVLRVSVGAVSLVSPEDGLEALECALQCAARREPFCSPLLYPVVMSAMRAALQVAPEARAGSRTALALSLRELEVARMVSSGLTNGEVARALHLSERTVKTHLTRIYGKLGARGRQDLASRLSASF